jgi:hypothetical protein
METDPGDCGEHRLMFIRGVMGSAGSSEDVSEPECDSSSKPSKPSSEPRVGEPGWNIPARTGMSCGGGIAILNGARKDSGLLKICLVWDFRVEVERQGEP